MTAYKKGILMENVKVKYSPEPFVFVFDASESSLKHFLNIVMQGNNSEVNICFTNGLVKKPVYNMKSLKLNK